MVRVLAMSMDLRAVLLEIQTELRNKRPDREAQIYTVLALCGNALHVCGQACGKPAPDPVVPAHIQCFCHAHDCAAPVCRVAVDGTLREPERCDYCGEAFWRRPFVKRAEGLAIGRTPPDGPVAISAACWYCMKPGYLYRHSGGYNIALCDACRDAGQ